MSALLAAKKADQVFICTSCSIDAGAVRQYRIGPVGTDSLCGWCRRALAQTAYAPPAREPLVVQHGAMTFSASLDLEPARRVIWDVNGYYRELGVSPHASKAELRRAYQDSVQDDRLTYIAKILLSDATRIEYDLLQPGQLWFDPWLAAKVREQALAEAEGTDISEADEAADETQSAREQILEQEDRPIDLRPPVEHWQPSAWGHYGWRAGPRDWLMARWRLLLARAAKELGVNLGQIMVGVMRSSDPVGFQRTRGGTIFFLETDAVATIDLARSVIVSAGQSPHD